MSIMAFECPDRRRPRPEFETDRRELDEDEDGPAAMIEVDDDETRGGR